MPEQKKEGDVRPSRNGSRVNTAKKKGGGLAVTLAAVVVCLGVLVVGSMGTPGGPGNAAVPTPDPSGTSAPEVGQSLPPMASPTPTPVPTPESTPYDYSAPAPEREAVDMDYFADAVFIGDSRTDGLQLYSGIKGTTFLSYKGITVFDVMEREDKKVVEIDGQKYTILEALGKETYEKVYISLGVNELGYRDSVKFAEEYGKFIDEVRRLQDGAEIYVQSLVPVNPEKCKSSRQPDWLNNEGVARYNEALRAMCREKQVVFLDISQALTDEQGLLPADATVDGLHFTRSWYEKWLAYLMTHTVDPA